MTVFVSAGHYPQSPGIAIGDVTEHDEATTWVSRLSAAIPDSVVVPVGAIVSKTRFIRARAERGDVAIEIHFGEHRWGEEQTNPHGCSAMFDPGSRESGDLALACQDAMEQFFPPHRGVVAGYYRGRQDRGIHFFLERVSVPAVMLLPEMMSEYERAREFRDECCAVLAEAISRFVRLGGA